MLQKSRWLIIAVFSLMLSSGCAVNNPLASDSNNSSHNPPAAISFTPFSNGAPNSNYLKPGSTSNEDLWLKIEADRITSDVLGASFHLVFNSNVIDYLDSFAGDFFPAQAINLVTLQDNDPAASKLIIAVANLNQSNLSNGSGTILTLHFRAIAPGVSSLTFVENHLQDAQTQDVAVDGWYGGTVAAAP